MIRAYEAPDLNQLLDVWYEASCLAHPFLSEEFLDQERDNIQNLYLPMTETWVYLADERVVGFISLLGDEVGAIFVHPMYHGRGIGRQLMDWAAARRDYLELEVFVENPIGRRFYERYGFRQVAEGIHEDTGFPLLRMMYRKSKVA